jgi:hypothetical protein
MVGRGRVLAGQQVGRDLALPRAVHRVRVEFLRQRPPVGDDPMGHDIAAEEDLPRDDPAVAHHGVEFGGDRAVEELVRVPHAGREARAELEGLRGDSRRRCHEDHFTRI